MLFSSADTTALTPSLSQIRDYDWLIAQSMVKNLTPLLWFGAGVLLPGQDAAAPPQCPSQ